MGSDLLIGASTKMYFGHHRSIAWLREVGDICRNHAAVRDGRVRFFVVPGFTSLVEACRQFDLVGAQDMHWEDSGAFTGEVSPVELVEVGVKLVEVGHFERRHLFGETDETVARKVAAAYRHGLAPLLCVGEDKRVPVAEAVATCEQQVAAAVSLTGARPSAALGVVAYEPAWAIGAPAPAPSDHIAAVCAGLRERLRDGDTACAPPVIYGGTAGPGLLGETYPAVDGLFLGRRAHDSAAVGRVLDEVAALPSRSARIGFGV